MLAEYGLAPNLAVQAVLPLRLLQTRTTYSDLAGDPITLDYPNIHHRNETLVGFADAQLFLHSGGRLLGLDVSGRAGVSLPLGKIESNPFALEDLGLPHEHIQFGTGTFDPLIGLDVAKNFGGWSLAGFAQAQTSLYANRFGYQAGARTLGGAVGSTTLLEIPLRVGATFVHEFPERWNGRVPSEDGNLGRSDLFLGPGATLPFGSDYSLSIDVRARVWGAVAGAQFDMPVVVSLSVGRLFHLENIRSEKEEAESANERGDVEVLVREGEAAPLEPVPEKWTLFDFWAPWCEACKQLGAQLEDLAAENDSIAVRKINIVDFDSAIAKRELPGVELLPHVRLLAPDRSVFFESSGTPTELMARIRDATTKR